jgi:hypothetical protein
MVLLLPCENSFTTYISKMKTTRIIAAFAILGLATITSCKKSYTCSCNTVVGAGSVETKHSIENAYLIDAKRSCLNYQDQANSTLPGGTTCHL